MSERWTLGVLIGLPLTIIGVLIFATISFFLVRQAFRTEDDIDGPFLLGFGAASALAALALVVGVLGFGFYPYSSDYHKWKPVSGTVSSNTAVAIQTSWVIQFEGSPVKYDCLETRCADMAPGHDVTLLCIHRFVWGGTDWIECKYGEG